MVLRFKNCNFLTISHLFSTDFVRRVPKFRNFSDKSIGDGIRNWLRQANERADGSHAEEEPEPSV